MKEYQKPEIVVVAITGMQLMVGSPGIGDGNADTTQPALSNRRRDFEKDL